MISVEIIAANFTFLGQTICNVLCMKVLLQGCYISRLVCMCAYVGRLHRFFVPEGDVASPSVCYGRDGYLRMRCVKSA